MWLFNANLSIVPDLMGFVSRWETTGANETIQLPITNLYTIDWGDGNETTTETSHEYLLVDEYAITSGDAITDFNFNNSGDKIKLLEVSNFGVGWMFAGPTFWGCSNFDITSTETITIINGIGTFRSCTSLIWNSSLSNAIISGQANNMFRGCTLLNQPLFSLANVTSLSATLGDCSAYNQPIPSDTGNVTRMDRFLENTTSFDQSLANLDFSSVTRMDNFMAGKTNADYSTANMDSLLNRLNDPTFGLNFGIATNVNVGLGSIDYTSAGATALSDLNSDGYVFVIGNEV